MNRMTEAEMLAHKRAVDADRRAIAMNKARARRVLAAQAMQRVAGCAR